MYSFHHVAISVSNIELSGDFYKALGYEEALHFDAQNDSFKIKHLKLGEAFLELFWFKNSSHAPKESKELGTDLPINGVKHFALQVGEIEDAKEDLIKRKIASEIKIREGEIGVKYFFICDPDGMLVEILEDKRGL